MVLIFGIIDVNGTEVKMILPEGLRNVLALNVKVRSMLAIEGRFRGSNIYKVKGILYYRHTIKVI